MPKKKEEESKAYALLLSSQRLAPYTRLNYKVRIDAYLKHVGKTADELVEQARRRPKEFEEEFIAFIRTKVEKFSPSTVWIYRDSVKKLLELNRVEGVGWDYVAEFLPRNKKSGQDRAPTLEEVKRLVDRADLRTKCLILFLCSSGARIGSVEYLRWRDVEEVEVGGKRFARVTVYRGEREEYKTFVSPECYEHLMEYRRGRERLGEKVKPASYVFVTMPNKRRFDAGKVKPMTAKTLKNQLGVLQNEVSGRSVLKETEGYRNYEFKQVHGFRKFFKTRMEVAGAKPIMTEMMMGHELGVTSSYMKPTSEELAAEYAKSVPAITVMSRETVTKEDLEKVKHDAKLESLRSFAADIGIDPEKVKVEAMEGLTPEEQEKLINQVIRDSLKPKEDPQMVVSVDQVEQSLKDGWEFVASLPNGKVIVRR